MNKLTKLFVTFISAITLSLVTFSSSFAKVEVAPKFEGRQIMMILVPQVAK